MPSFTIFMRKELYNVLSRKAAQRGVSLGRLISEICELWLESEKRFALKVLTNKGEGGGGVELRGRGGEAF